MSIPSPPITNPLDRLRRRLRLALALHVPVLMAIAWWALKPLTIQRDFGLPTFEVGTREVLLDRAPEPAIDSAAFEVSLWNPVPPPEVPAPSDDPPERPPPPLNIQLIGIITELVNGRTIQRAALYDVDADRMLLVADGEALREHIVRVQDDGLVELVRGNVTHRYRLRPDEDRGSS